jgi:hypothetical protein
MILFDEKAKGENLKRQGIKLKILKVYNTIWWNT